MIRQALTLSAAFLVLGGCAPLVDKSMEGTKAAREFATQQVGTCCYVGYRLLPDDEKPKVDQEKAELARQLAAANAALATKGQGRAELARQLEEARAALAAKEQERAELARQLDAAANATLVAKEGEKVTAEELAKILSEMRAVALRNILFDTNKAAIKPESDMQLAEVGKLLKGDQALKLVIQGNTDNIGEKAYNQTLSQARAAAVKDYVVKKYGIAADRLSTVGFGSAKPVASNATSQGRALNRRVELVKR